MTARHTCLALISFLLISKCTALPLVDAGLFVILGVSTCRDGTGYCLLGSDCTLDHDFSPDDTAGHCNGLRAAFTPAANFVCCKYNGADTKTTTTTSRSTSLPPLITTPENKPSRRPVINGGGSIKPQSTDNNDTPGAIFWVDLASDGTKPTNLKYGAQNSITKLGETHPGSTLTVSGHIVSDNSVPVHQPSSIENWIKPGVTMNVPGIIASNPGSTVTIAVHKDDLLNGIVQGVSSEVAHGVSITQTDDMNPTPSLSIQLDLGESPSLTNEDEVKPVNIGGIEHHEFMNGNLPLVEAETSEVKPDFSVKPDELEVSSSAPVAPLATSTTKKPSTTAEPEDEDEDDEEEDSEEGDDDDEDDEDDGLFGLTDLVDFLGFDTQKKEASIPLVAKNASISNDVESKLGDQTLPTAGIDTEDVEDEEEEEDDEVSDDKESEIQETLENLALKLEERIDNVTEDSSNLVGGFLDITTNQPEEETTQNAQQEEDEEPPLCLGPVREPRDPACWAVNFESRVNGSVKSLCSGARVTRDLVVTSASCAVRVFMAGVKETRALLPAGDDSPLLTEVTEVVVHESYRAAPHMSLHDIGLIRLKQSGNEVDMGKCTLCLPQDSRADFSHLACHSPRYSLQASGRGGNNASKVDAEKLPRVELEPRTTSARNLCDSVTKARTEDDARFPTFLCSAPARINKQQVSRVPSEGVPLVCSGRRSIPVLAGVMMTSQQDANDWTLYTPISNYVEWIRANQLPELTVSSGVLSS